MRLLVLVKIDGHLVQVELTENETLDLIAKLTANLQNAKRAPGGYAANQTPTFVDYDGRITAGVILLITDLELIDPKNVTQVSSD